MKSDNMNQSVFLFGYTPYPILKPSFNIFSYLILAESPAKHLASFSPLLLPGTLLLVLSA
jgi:hypothetical protein